MDGPDNLSSELLSYIIVPTGILAELLHHVNRKVFEHFKEYELAMREIHQYYDLPLIHYNYTDDIVMYGSAISM